ncbi:RNA polymerase sigma factor [Enterococcus faecalis]|uniref:RNA polymerase sigma factor n=1 Tax=Enterococcus faecalis TaxID=1351 RepID=UPI0022435EA9
MATDALLVKKAKRGDNDAFICLFKNYEQTLYNMARKFLTNEEDIADCLQETLFDAYKNIHTLKQPKYFNTWICKILINNSKKILIANHKLSSYDEKIYSSKSASIDSIELREMLLGLDSKYSEPLVLFYYNGFSLKEISNILELPLNTVKTRIYRAKEQLRITNEEE